MIFRKDRMSGSAIISVKRDEKDPCLAGLDWKYKD
jgi:hypothetical protein